MATLKSNNTFVSCYGKYMSFIGVAGQSTFLFQIAKILQTHSARDVSFTGVLVAFVSMLSWAFYGYLNNDKVLIGVNILGVTLAFICLVVILLH